MVFIYVDFNKKATIENRNMRTKANNSLCKTMSDINEAKMEEEHMYVAEGESSRWDKRTFNMMKGAESGDKWPH